MGLNVMSDEIKRYYDNKRASSKFKEGIAVWLYDPHKEKGISYSKVNEKLARPYVVTKCISDLVYHIQLGPNTKPNIKVVYRNRLWHYSGHNPPSYLVLQQNWVAKCC